jgi:hypothetical protein
MATPGIQRRWRTLRLSNPAVGTDWEIAPGGQRWWRIVSFTAVLTTSLAAGARGAVFRAEHGGSAWMHMPAPNNQNPNTAVTYAGHTNTTRDGSALTTFLVPLPTAGLLIPHGGRFVVVTANLDVADQWSSIVAQVEEIPSGLDYEGDQLTTPVQPMMG